MSRRMRNYRAFSIILQLGRRRHAAFSHVLLLSDSSLRYIEATHVNVTTGSVSVDIPAVGFRRPSRCTLCGPESATARGEPVTSEDLISGGILGDTTFGFAE